MRYRVLPYRQGSRSAKALATALGGKVLKLEGSSYNPQEGDVIINWGNTTENYPFGAAGWLNDPSDIREASNKLLFFRKMPEGLTPQYWENKDDIPDDAFPVVCRTVLAGHSGDGIVIAGCRDDLVDASLYVKYEKKKDEYRIHLGRKGESITTIAVQRKARRQGVQANWQVRNHQNGFVYVRNGFTAPQEVIDKAIKAFEATGLDFGGVDVIWNANQQRAFVLEINTACGLEGQTVTDYADFFKGKY